MTIYFGTTSANAGEPIDERGRLPWWVTQHARKAGFVVGAVALLGSTGVAYAIFGDGRTPEKPAKAGLAVPVTVEPIAASAVTEGLLLPGGPKGTVKVTVRNSGATQVRVTDVEPLDRPVTATGGRGVCAPGAVTFLPVTLAKDNTIGAGLSRTLTLAGAAQMSEAAADGCQGAAFTIPVRVTVVSG